MNIAFFFLIMCLFSRPGFAQDFYDPLQKISYSIVETVGRGTYSEVFRVTASDHTNEVRILKVYNALGEATFEQHTGSREREALKRRLRAAADGPFGGRLAVPTREVAVVRLLPMTADATASGPPRVLGATNERTSRAIEMHDAGTMVTRYAPLPFGRQATPERREAQLVALRALAAQMLEAIAGLSQEGLVNSDVKPENIAVDQLGNFRLLDLDGVVGIGAPFYPTTARFAGDSQLLRKPASTLFALNSIGHTLATFIIGKPPVLMRFGLSENTAGVTIRMMTMEAGGGDGMRDWIAAKLASHRPGNADVTAAGHETYSQLLALIVALVEPTPEVLNQRLSDALGAGVALHADGRLVLPQANGCTALGRRQIVNLP